MYWINGQQYFTEAHPALIDERLGAVAQEHRYFAHHYALPNGDVYLVTCEGKIVYLAADSDAPKCVFEPSHGFAPRYYQAVTPHIGFDTVLSVPGGAVFVPIYCEELYRGRGRLDTEYGSPMIARGSRSNRPFTEDILVVLVAESHCVVFRKGVKIYDGFCDMRGVPKIETRGGLFSGAEYRATPMQEYQWAKDEEGKYLGAGVDRSKTWDWVNVSVPHVDPNTYIMNGTCQEYAISDMGGDAYVKRGVWYDGCELPTTPGTASMCNQEEMRPDPGEFARHFTDKFWFNCCSPLSGECVDSLERGMDYVQNDGIINSAQILDYQDGYALLPLNYGLPRHKLTTFIGTINNVSELPGYEGDLNDLKQSELDAYEVRYTTDCERNPADGVIRRGIQFNDCFRVGTTEDYYRYEFNGWKLYEGSYTEDHLRRFLPVYAIITPDMTGEGSAQVADGSGGDCACKKPVYTIRGNNIQRCGNWFIASEGGRNSSGYYMIFNREYGGLYREGVGRVSVSCVACWSVLQTFHHDGSSTIEIFGEGGGTGAIWSTTIPAAGSWRISNVGAHSRRDQMGDTHWYMYIRRGNNVTVLCCSGVVISVNTPHNYGQNADHVWANIHRQRFAGLYEAPGRVHVIEGCNVVFTGCGALESAWGTANALVRTCKIVDIPKANVAELSRTNAQGVQVWQMASNCLPAVYPDGSVNCDSRCGRGRDFTGAVTTTRIIQADYSTYLFIDLITGYIFRFV